MAESNTNDVGSPVTPAGEGVDPVLAKSLKIKTQTLLRNLKDLQYANTEVVKETERLEVFKKENPDKVNQQKNVIQEAEMMVPHAKNRIRRSNDELEAFLRENEEMFPDPEMLQPSHDALEKGKEAVDEDEE